MVFYDPSQSTIAIFDTRYPITVELISASRGIPLNKSRSSFSCPNFGLSFIKDKLGLYGMLVDWGEEGVVFIKETVVPLDLNVPKALR